MPGWLKALWIVAVVLIPFFGPLIHLLFRPFAAESTGGQRAYAKATGLEESARAAEKLAKPCDLLDKGRMSHEEFEKKKAQLMQD
jgi:hypothetical protein